MVDITILAGQSLSDGVNVTGTLRAICAPPALTPALFTFQMSPDAGTTWYNLMTDGGQEFSVNLRPGGAYRVAPGTILDNKSYLKIRSGSRDNPVPQVQDRVFSLVMD